MSGGVLIMAGGTGGHIFPGLAVAAELRARGVPVAWLGARGAMETTAVPNAGLDLHVVDIAGLRGKGAARWIALPFHLARAVLQARRVLRRLAPACALSFGGYASGPGGLAAWLSGVPLVIHEQNRVPGLTNRVLARFARRVLQAFSGTFAESRQARTCGNPVRASVLQLPAPAERLSGRDGPARLLVTGGSQGARVLNTLLPAALAHLPGELRPVVRHQCGRGREDETRAAYRAAGVEAELSEFIDDMASAYAEADLVVCRSGALTVSELAAAGVASVLIPFPHAVDDHQARNAEVLVEAGAARALNERGLDAEHLAGVLHVLLADRALLRDMAERALSVAQPRAAQCVADACAEWVTA